MKIRVTAIVGKYAQVINTENMKYGALPILDIWERAILRAFITQEEIDFNEVDPIGQFLMEHIINIMQFEQFI